MNVNPEGEEIKVELSDAQKLAVLKMWNESPSNRPPSLQDMIKAAYPNDSYDGRTAQGRAVKAFLATRQLRARPAQEHQPKDPISLTSEQEEFIVNNCTTMKFVEMARIIFKNSALTPLNQETRVVMAFAKGLNNKVLYEVPVESTDEDYKPPKVLSRIVARINRYVQNANLDETKLTARQKKDCNALIGYLHTYRFIHQISSYSSIGERELFESSFIRYTWDKNDLTEEEVDQYIILSIEVVMSSAIQKHIKDLQKIVDDIIDAENDEEKRKKFSQGLVEAMGQARKEYNECVNRQDKMLKNLVGKRSERLKLQQSDTASILNLVQMWKEEDTREQLIKLAEMRQQLIKDEIERLSSLDEVKARIFGLSEDEALHG
jgi:hypothetical protein